MADAKSPTTDIEFAMALGRLEGQVKELVHNVAGKAQRDEALGRTMAKLESMPDDLRAIRENMQGLSDRLSAIELKQGKEEVKQGLVAAFFNSPVVLWITIAAGGFWAIVTDKIKL